MKGWAAVIPSNRPDRLERFLESWDYLFKKHFVDVIVVRDEPPWEGIPPFIPRGTDMIRSWGFYQAWKKPHVSKIVSLDDDTEPADDIFEQYDYEFERGAPFSSYYSVGSHTTTGLEMRGFPQRGRHSEVVFQYGGWHGSADLDAATQLATKPQWNEFHETVVPVPVGAAVTCCAMNFCFRADYAMLAWQLPLYDGGRYNRFGDIWSGLIQKRCLDALGKVMLVNGPASVRHERASDPFMNLEREQPGMKPNEDVWEVLQESVAGRTMREVFFSVTNSFVRYFMVFDREYAEHFAYCRDAWAALFDEL